MQYPTNLTLSATSTNISDGVYSPFYDITWSFKYKIVNWNEDDNYGFCLFLQDSNIPLEGGGRSIDLGYSGPESAVLAVPGMKGGIIGIGLDTNGFFAATTEWPVQPGAPGYNDRFRDGVQDNDIIPNSVAVRLGNSFNYLENSNTQIQEFDLLSDGVKIIRARLGNLGRTIYLDYRSEGNTEFVNLLTADVNLNLRDNSGDLVLGERFTPGVSFANPLTSTDTDLRIQVISFHTEGKEFTPSIVDFVDTDKAKELGFSGDLLAPAECYDPL